jgi:hypothetical protein
MRSVMSASSSALAPVIPKPISSVNHGEMPVLTVSQAVVYAPIPTNAAWPKEVSPPIPVSSTRPRQVRLYRPM